MGRFVVLVAILVGFALRLLLIDSYPLREDEALYGFWARHFWHEDPFFLTVWPDKPPIFIWLLSLTFQFLHPEPASARFLNIIISTLTIPIIGAIAQATWHKKAGITATIAYALNPFAISFAPTAFTDPLLVFTGSLALLFSLQARFFWTGFWLGIAIMTKQQGMLYVPLVIGSWWLVVGGWSLANFWKQLWHFTVGITLIILPILYWDSLRWSVAPSPWDLSIRNYNALTLASIDQWQPRLNSWLQLLWYLTASWWVWALLICYLILKFISTICARPRSSASYNKFSTLITLWSIAFIALHLFTTLQTWDRYLLPLAPILALLIAKLIHSSPHLVIPSSCHLVILSSLLILPAYTAAQGHLPIGSDHGAYTGLHEVNQWLIEQAENPQTAILYHRTLGWHHRFYLYDELAVGNYEIRWYPHEIYLVDNAIKTPDRRKYLVQPNWQPLRRLELHATIQGLKIEQRLKTLNFVLYEIIQPPQPPCTWCVCNPGIQPLFIE